MRKRTWIRWIPAVVWMAVIFVMSHQSGDDLGSVLPFFQRFFPAMEGFDWGHFVAYFVLGLTFLAALAPRSFTWTGKVVVVICCVLYGLTDEFHQSFVPGRSPDWMDIRNDGIGAAIAMLVVSVPPIERMARRMLRL